MILRVYAMWNQSKRIIYILLSIYVPQVVGTFVYLGIYYNPNTYLSSMSQAKPEFHPLTPFFFSHSCPSY